ncbi:hypothetical protein ACFL54_09675 [Planctomycetota bacterium]
MNEKIKIIKTSDSYKLFREWADFLSANPSTERILSKLLFVLRDNGCFSCVDGSLLAFDSLKEVEKELTEMRETIPTITIEATDNMATAVC